MIYGDAQTVARKQNATRHTNRRYFVTTHGHTMGVSMI